MSALDPDLLEDTFVAFMDTPVEDRPRFLQALEPGLAQKVAQLAAEFGGFDEQVSELTPDVLVDPSQMVTLSGDSHWQPHPLQPTLPGDDPETIERFRILGRIGIGGMGRVYLAEEPHPRRRVALKLIRSVNLALSDRFRQEYQALAMMNHENIARLFEVGSTLQGELFFTMEYVPGKPITACCDRLSLPQRVDLFLQVCHGVQHAHQKALLHRDLKPNNILVTQDGDRPVVKIIDFGLAKELAPVLSEPGRETQVGTIVGTPAYMAPELVSFNPTPADVRGDIYALGVILYEMLAGCHPLDHLDYTRLDFDSLRTHVTRGISVPPGRRLRKQPQKHLQDIPADLDWIVMKALDPDMERRYDGVAGLIADLNAFRSDRPVEARPPSLGYRVGKFLRRNKLWVGAAAFAFAVTLLAMVLVARYAIRAEEARAQAEMSLAKANTSLDLVFDILRTPDPRNQGGEIRVIDALRQKEQALGNAGSEEATLRLALGRTYFGLASYEAAARNLERAIELSRDGDPDTWGRALFYLSYIDYRRSRLKPAKAGFEAILDGLTKREDLDIVRAHAMFGLGLVLDDLERHDQAEARFNEALVIQKARLGERHPETIKTLSGLARNNLKQGREATAEALFKQVLNLQQELLGEDHVETLSTKTSLGFLYRKTHRHREAVSILRACWHSRRSVLGSDHDRTQLSLYNLIQALRDDHQLVEAESLADQLVADRRKSLGETASKTIKTVRFHAQILARSGRVEEALAKLEQLEKEVILAGSSDDRQLHSAMHLRGRYLLAADRLDEAFAVLTRTHDLRTRHGGPDHVLTISTRHLLAELYARWGDQSGARAILESDWLHASTHDPTQEICTVLMPPLGLLLYEEGSFDEALLLLENSFAAACRDELAIWPRMAQTMARLYQDRGNGADAAYFSALAR